jgi:DNA-binding PadR family transcriptional regulator
MPTDLVLLGLLHIDEFYGYELIKIIKTVMLQITDITTGTLYYKLKGLEKRGLVSHLEEQDGRRPVRFRYSITPEGREAFQHMSQENILQAGRPYWPIMPSLFFINLLDPDESRRALKKRIERLEAELSRLENLKDHIHRAGGAFQADLIVQHGMEHIRIDIDILNRFIDGLADSDLNKFDADRLKERLQHYMEIMPDLERV